MDTKGLRVLLFAVVAAAFLGAGERSLAQLTIVATNATWKYLDDGSNQGVAWRAGSFIDSSWSNGIPQFGYGDGDETTVVGYGPDLNNKYVTTYFRHTFNLDNAFELTNLLVRVIRDDGAVVYINGTEVLRDNLPSGDVLFSTYALAAIEDSTVFAHPAPSLLVNGPNTIAVEIHQATTNSTDISFAFQLIANYQPAPPSVSMVSPGHGSTMNAGNITVLADASDTDGSVTNVEFYANGTKIGQDTAAPYQIIWIGVTPGTYTLFAEATDSLGLKTPSQTVVVNVVPPPQGTLITLGGVWKYLATNQASAPTLDWIQANYNDSTWLEGAAELGYGDGDEATQIPCGLATCPVGSTTAGKWITSYYRKKFIVANPSVYTSLSASLVYDDGAVVYINGQEAYRVNMPQGTVNWGTLGSGALTEPYPPDERSLDPSLLIPGENIIAVEMHQSGDASSDVSFAFQLVGIVPPSVSIISPTNGSSFEVPVNFTATADASDDGTITRVEFYLGQTFLGASTNAPYSVIVTNLQEGSYSLTAKAFDNTASSTVSAPVAITVLDPNPPALVGANASTNKVSVVFSKPVVGPSATTIGNYSISPTATILSAQFGSSSNIIELSTSLTPGQTYTLTVNNVRDRANRVIAANSQTSFQVIGFSSGDVGSPIVAGSSAAVAGGFNVTGAGADIGGTSDQFQFNYESSKRVGDFDLRVRVASLALSDAWAKAALMARETLDANSKFAAAVATPSVSGSFFLYRVAAGGTATNSGYGPVTYPNMWLRLKRQGTTLTGYMSPDGNSWATLGSITFTALANDLYVGLAVTSRKPTQAATAEFRDFAAVSGGTISGLKLNREPLGPSSRKTGIVISEIMYHPRSFLAGYDLDDNPIFTPYDIEFIELHNSNPYPEDIGDHRISGAVDYKFAPGTVMQPGAFLVVARNPAAVQSHYGISGVLGPWVGAETNGLPGGGGRVRLRSEGDAVLLEVNYDVDPPWPVAADGAGHSVVLARPSYGENDVRAWAASANIDGSPGRDDPYSADPLDNVMINEFLAHTDLPLEDFVELYNHANQPVNISGAYLTDEANRTNQFRIPNGTIIPARGHVSFQISTEGVGFALSSAGERIYLVNSNRTRVIDAVKFDAQENGVSTGRYPDGNGAWYRLASLTPGQANSGIRQDPIVINEIMYNPISGDDDDEYLELYNRGNQPVDVSGWRFVDGIEYIIPAGTTIASDGYLVIARNAARLMSNNANLNVTNTKGDYDGGLGNGGERIALAKPDFEVFTNSFGELRTNVHYVVVNEVTYGDDGRWGKWSDGGGSSLELKDARGDNRLAANWTDSDETTKGIWTTIEGIGTLGESLGSPINDNLQIFLLGIGECLVDDVEVRGTLGTGPNLIQNPGFESGLTSWTPQGSHDHTVASIEALSGSGSMRVRAASRGDNGANRIRSAAFTAPSGAVLLRAKAKWLRGWPELLLRIHGGTFEVGGPLNIQPNLGTPGAPNGKAVPNAGPAVYDVAHAPILPAGDEAVVVTARGSDPNGVSLALKYRIEPGASYSTLAMLDNGTGGDSVAGDGIYSTTVPPQSSGARMGFYIEATDLLGGVNTFPQDVFPTPPETRVFPTDAPNRECIVRWGDGQIPGSLGTYRLWLNAANTTRWNTRRPLLNNSVLDATFVYNNSRVVYNMRPSYAGSPWHRGQMTTGPDGTQRVDYDIEFPNDERFLGAADAVWNNPGNPGGADTSDGSAQSEQSSYTIFKEIGVQYNHRRFVHVFVNGSQRSTRSTPGNFVFEDSQQANTDVVEEWFPDDTGGHLYKIEDWFEFPDNGDDFTANNDADLIRRTINVYASPSAQPEVAPQTSAYRFMWRRRAVGAGESANDYSSFFAALNAANVTGGSADTVNPTALGTVVDWEQWMRIFAVQHTIGNWDSYGYDRGKNAYMYKGAAQDAKFHQWTWDIDFTMGIGGHGATMDIFGSTDPRVIAMWNTPATLRAYWRAYYDIIHGPLNNAFMDPILDAKAAALRDNNINFTASSVTTIKNFVRDRRNYLAGRLTALTNAAFSANVSAPSANVNTVTISGGAPIQVYEIRVNGVPYPVTWSGPNVPSTRAPTNWTMTVSLNPGLNTLVIEALDNKGRVMSSRTNNVVYNGPGVSPVGSVVIGEIMYNSSTPGADFVEIANISDNTAFDVSGWRLNGVDFTFPSGTILVPNSFVVLVEDAIAFGNAFGSPAPVFVYSGNLDNGGETLTLIKPGATPAQDLVVDRVKYDDDAPWAAAADGRGASLSLIDAAEDNARVSNWTDAQGWRKIVITGTNQGSATISQRGTNFFMFLNSAGIVNIDDMYLCEGNVPETGPNLLVNGDFESALTGPWTMVGNHSGTVRDTSVFRTGAGSMRIVATGTGSTSGQYLRQFIPGSPTNRTITLSFWVLPTTNGSTMTIRTAPGSQFNFIALSVRPVLATPGAVNTLVDDLPAYPQLWLNEVQAVNLTGIADNTGDRDPWIELYNSSASPISLDGYYLANNFSTLTQWQFPPGSTINPGAFKLVWADGETGESTATDWHTSFGLSGPTGVVALVRMVASEPQIVDYLTYGGQQAGRSYGDVPDGQLFTRQLFITPTPGQTNIVNSPVFINEWMAANATTIQDPVDLQFQDWIELYNASLEPVDISGYGLTDSASTPREYEFPDGTVIPAGGFLLIWADDEMGQEAVGGLHATFRLDNSGDEIYLFSPAQVLLDRVDFRTRRQTNDISMGRFPDAGVAPYHYMRTPTPGAPNQLDGTGENRAPNITPIGDKYVILGQTLQFQVLATDPDGDSLTYSMSGAPAGATIGQSSGIFQFTPTQQQTPSDTTVNITVTDDGTPPRNANRSFTVHVSPPPGMTIGGTPGSMIVGFPTVPGKNYQVQFKNNLGDADWQDLGTPQLANGFTLQINDNFTGSQRFYRLVVLD
jgi:lamin tail-like protein/Big-like domain-containing protein/CotH protein